MKAFKINTVLAVVIVFFSCQTSYPTLPYAALAQSNIRLPYIKKYEAKGKEVLVYGSYHTNDTADAQMDDIEKHLDHFKPQVILYEGDYIGVEPTRNGSASTYFEMGLVRWWAQQHGVPELNLEPSAKQRFRFLQKKYSSDAIMLATILGQNILYIKQHSKQDFEKLFPSLISDFEKEGFELTEKQKQLSHFYEAYESFFKIPFDPATFDYEAVEPKFNKTLLNKISQESATFRDQFMLKRIDSTVKHVNKVYVQVGGRHAIVWQPALEKMMDKY